MLHGVTSYNTAANFVGSDYLFYLGSFKHIAYTVRNDECIINRQVWKAAASVQLHHTSRHLAGVITRSNPPHELQDFIQNRYNVNEVIWTPWIGILSEKQTVVDLVNNLQNPKIQYRFSKRQTQNPIMSKTFTHINVGPEVENSTAYWTKLSRTAYWAQLSSTASWAQLPTGTSRVTQPIGPSRVEPPIGPRKVALITGPSRGPTE